MKRYRVAGHLFDVRADEKAFDCFSLMDNYAPFEVSVQPDVESTFSLAVSFSGNNIEFTEETRQVDGGQEIVCGGTSDGLPVFVFYCDEKKAGTLVCKSDFRDATLHLEKDDGASGSRDSSLRRFALNNSLMVLFALATAEKHTALFHSAVVAYQNRGYMFLGKSGTGKSTHARMWLKRFADAELLNDDNPVVRLEADGIWVYGSPWSGKTPCYKNKRVALGGIVDLSQAPHNRTRPLQGIEAYMALVPSISGMRWDKRVADGLHATENRLAQEARMFHLECLPNEDAAATCYGAFEK